MPLLEIIRGKITCDETLAIAMDFAQAGKTPIVVNDARGSPRATIPGKGIHY